MTALDVVCYADRMTVGELKKLLSDFPDDVPIIAGCDDVSNPNDGAMWVAGVRGSPGWRHGQSLFFPALELRFLKWNGGGIEVDRMLARIGAFGKNERRD